MRTDAYVLGEIEAAFGDCQRPEHFTNHRHCEECADHDALLRSRDRASLQIDDVGNQAWDPICFCTPQALAYYMPALARLSLQEPAEQFGWYGGHLTFHLSSGDWVRPFYEFCNPRQRGAVAALLSHFIESRSASPDFDADETMRALKSWES